MTRNIIAGHAFVILVPREVRARIERLLARAPSVLLTGPRQVGKTTTVWQIVEDQGAAYVDLEDPRDRAEVADVNAFCARNADRLVVFDGIHRVPGLFEPLRGIIDCRRRDGRRTGQFLFVGPADVGLLRQTGETLAGRVAYCEMQPMNIRDADAWDVEELWERGGMPESLMADFDPDSFEWRTEFVETYLERDIPDLGSHIGAVPSETMRRFWTMLARNQGREFSAAALAEPLEQSRGAVERWSDLMVDLLLVRRLLPWRSSTGEGPASAPKIYLRDSGICHALLGIESLDELLGHPVADGSWKGFVIENVVSGAPRHARCSYYRASGGAEIDLVLELGSQEVWGIEITRAEAPRASSGFRAACEAVGATRRIVVHGGAESRGLRDGVEALTLRDLCGEMGARAGAE